MVTRRLKRFTRTTVLPGPTHRNTELAVTTTPPGSRCDGWPVVTPTHNITGPCNAIGVLRQRIEKALTVIDQRHPRGRDDDDYTHSAALLPRFPGKPYSGDAAVLQVSRTLFSHLHWEEEGDHLAVVLSNKPRPPFIVAQRCGKLVLTTWGHIDVAPWRMWESNGATSIPVVQSTRQLQEALTW